MKEIHSNKIKINFAPNDPTEQQYSMFILYTYSRITELTLSMYVKLCVCVCVWEREYYNIFYTF